MAPFIQTANLSVIAPGANTIVSNPYTTVAQAQARGYQRGAVVRVHSYNVQNQNATTTVNASFIDSSGAVLAGPFQIPPSTGNWTERATVPGFLFETTRAASTPFVGYNLQLSTSAGIVMQVFVEYSISFTPGRVAA